MITIHIDEKEDIVDSEKNSLTWRSAGVVMTEA
jgi:hypothetical protein